MEEEKRLAVLEQYALLGTEDEAVFDDITHLASYLCRTPIALISLVTHDKQWLTSKVGSEVAETSREIALYHHAIQQRETLIINNALEDERFKDNPLVTGAPHIRFYAGVPIITPEEDVLGTLCVINPEPEELTADQQSALEALARQVMNLLECRRAKAETAHLQKILDREQERVLVKEKEARQLAEEANHLKDNFLATVSHELRTPLTAILGWAKMLDSGTLDAESTARAVETIVRNANSQAQLIDDLLDISRIISSKLRLDARPVELPPLIEAAIESASLAAEARSIRIQTILDPQAGAVTGDSERLQQIFWNLLSNAIKFTPKGGKVQVRLERINSHLEFTVSDTGQGIESEFLPHVFERFRQADGSNSRSSSGLGLGLAIVHHLVELHGGTIYAESEGEGRGATFKVILPLRIISHPAGEEMKKEHRAVSRGITLDMLPTLEGVRVLVVDDEEDARTLIQLFLAQRKAEVLTCATTAEALEAIQSQRPHVLISDIGMPVEDGYSLIRKVRKLKTEQGGQTPAIALTAFTRVEDRIRAMANGFQVFIPKPIEPAELIAAVGSMAELGKRII